MKHINHLFSLMGTDGMKHFILTATLTALLALVLPAWMAALITTAVGTGKEIHDRISGRGAAQWKDVLCNLLGTLVGMI